jgi:hypothetical protein
MITPNSIPSPPPAVGPTQGAPVPAATDLVVDQYAGLGLRFPTQPGALPGMGLSVAVVRLAGVDAWAPATLTEAVAGRVASLDYSRSITGQLGRPTGSLSVEVVGGTGETLFAYDSHGRLVGSAIFFGGRPGPHGGELLSVQGADIRSFTVPAPLLPLAAGSSPLPFPFPPPQPWGVAEVQVVAAPEPASLALAALGLGLALSAGVGRARRARRSEPSAHPATLGSRS